MSFRPDEPQWYKMLPDHLKPPPEKIASLELLRTMVNLPDEVFMMGITISPWAVIKVQEATLDELRRRYPHASEKELWKRLIAWRLNTILVTLGQSDLDRILRKSGSLDEIMERVHSWDDVLRFALDSHGELADPPFDPSGVQNLINEALEEK